jgi:hypothetical protein
MMSLVESGFEVIVQFKQSRRRKWRNSIDPKKVTESGKKASERKEKGQKKVFGVGGNEGFNFRLYQKCK